MKITVIGCGRWGSCIAWYLDKIGHNVTLYGRKTSKNMQEFLSTRSNGVIKLSDTTKLKTSLSDIENADAIVISINSQGLNSLMQELKAYNLKNKIFILCMKGIDIETKKRLSEIVEQNTDASNKVAVWLGPGHVQEFYSGIPNCMVIDSNDEKTKEILVSGFSSDLIRFYYGEDLIGNEIGAAAKNVIGIAAGMLDGYKLSTLKGTLMSRGTREIARLIKAMGGNELSAYGLCHLGDYEATVFSKYSHNRKFGECVITGEKYESLAEGYYTAKALKALGEKYNVDLPICNAVYAVLYENATPKKTLDELFARSLKNEFYK
ncbi:MAG: NAD(P)H-dependent glycerol-3-phosphate dehydrogenase [Oscillospiraceae bacterium]